ncbi:MAG: NAD(+)/NADH kinase, partial [Methanobrevibacter sp.]|nr:NAD(+)/NADH kinase [Methanobrevibacter sp.]
MKIYISEDHLNKNARKTKKSLVEISKELNIGIADEINESDIVISVGGDGTFLETARLCQEKPIIGINTGTLGYLTEVSPENIETVLKNILKGNYDIENRMMLEGEIIKPSGDVIEIPESLNEIAISKNTFGVVRFEVAVNEKLINSYTADGILVCTPTGS